MRYRRASLEAILIWSQREESPERMRGRSLALREAERGGESGGQSRPQPAEPPAGAPKAQIHRKRRRRN